jgi:type IV pilus assembly protein PilY1
MMCSFEKEIPMGFSEEFMLPPNVLLLLDTSGSMTWGPEDGENYHTRGDGTRPSVTKSSWHGGYSTRGVYFGKDIDVDQSDNNNDPLDPNNYHPLLRYIDTQEASADWPQVIYSRTLSEFDEYDSGVKDSFFAKYNGRYLFPNDSRMYKLKLVLWRIFNDPSLVSNLRMGLSTYYQYEGFAESEWYKALEYWFLGWYWSVQDTYWTAGNSTNYALLREDFSSTNDQDHMDALKKWVDGAEYFDIPDYEDNNELRADGGTPLASSIYNTISGKNCAYDFFDENGVIQGWCQDNYLIVLTDGADTDPHIEDHLNAPVNRVKQLYDESQNIVTFNGKPNSPVKTLVIGFIDPDVSGNTDLKDTLNEMADVGWDGEDDDNGPRGEGTSNQAYFANDVELLLDAFSEIFTTIQEKKGSGNAPLISPGSKLAGETATASVYVAPFTPDKDDDGQWEGHLEKYSLVDDAIPEEADWDAGLILDEKFSATRNIYTVDWTSSGNPVKFDTEIRVSLKDLMLSGKESVTTHNEYTYDDWDLFINWVRGRTDDGSEERWKLGDIYHSGLSEVGPPLGRNPDFSYRTFKTENASREKLLYVQANDGMLHAFNAEDKEDLGIQGGSERWAFIPPNVLYGGKLLGLKGHFELFNGNLEFDDEGYGTSVARYMLDGPLVVEDVFDPDEGEDGSWKTVLLAELGYAGAGMYAMDVTDPDSPEFLWALENAVYESSDDDVPDVYLGWNSVRGQNLSNSRSYVCHWEADGSGNVSLSEYAHDSDELPSELDYRDLQFSLSVPAVGKVTIPTQDGSESKWAAILGNGSNLGIAGGGNENTGRVYVVDILNGRILKTITGSDLSSSNLNQVVSPISVLRTNNRQKIDTFYFGDDDGTVTEVNIGDTWSYNKIVNVQGSGGLSYGIELGSFNGDTWLFFATGDIDPKVAKGSNKDYFVACNASEEDNLPLKKSDLTSIDPDVPESLHNAADPGWYFELTGKPVAPPKLYGGYLFFSSFVPNEEDLCKVGGSRLYIMDALTGEGAWENSSGEKIKYVELEGVQVSGITISNGKVYLGAIGHEGQGTDNLPDEMGGLGPSFENNLLVFDVPDPVGSEGNINIESGQMIPRYWREWIRR